MKQRFLVLCAALALGGSTAAAQGGGPLRLVRAIPLPNVNGRIDHMAADRLHARLFVAALGNNTVEIVDLHAGKVARTLRGLHAPQGVAYMPESDRFLVANGASGTAELFDGGTCRLLRSVSVGDDADNVRYDSAAHRVYVGYGGGGLSVLAAPGGEREASIALAGHPEAFQLEARGPKVFVNVPDADHIAVVDRGSRKVLATWPLAGAHSNFPMALDEANHRLFAGCRNPARALVYDTVTGRVVAQMDIVGDADDLFYDAARRRLYVSGGAGAIDVFQRKDADHYALSAHIATAAGARTSLFDPGTGRLYLAVPHRGGQHAEIRVYEAH